MFRFRRKSKMYWTMKRILNVICLLCLVVTTSSAQISMRQFLSGITVGQPIEKGVYASQDDMANLGCWMGAVNKNPVRGIKSPVAGSPLSWTGYGERDNSIVLGSSFSPGVHGQHPMCYGFQRSMIGGNVYLSFITDFKSIKNRKYWTAVGFSNQVWGPQHWCCAVFYPADNDGKSYNVGIRLMGGLMVVDRIFKTDEKHLIVLKYNIDSNLLSIFIDPDLSRPEPLPDEKVSAQIPDANNIISGLYIRDVSDNEGRLGSFRVARVWEDIR